MDATRVRWLRVLIGGVLAEAAVFVVVIPVYRLSGEHALLFVVPPTCLVACFAFGLWVARPLESRFVFHGILVGVVATLLYVAMTAARPEPVAYLVANGLKIVGGAAGGLVAGRRYRPP